MKYSVIVAIDNPYELISHFLENLLETTDFKDGELIIIIDGGRDYRTLEYVLNKSEEHSFIKVITCKDKLGYSCANNLGVKSSSGKNLVFINSDVLPCQGSISYLLDYLENNDACGAVQGLLIYPQNMRVQTTGHLFMENHNSHVFSGMSPKNTLVQITGKRQALTTAFIAIKKDTFIQNGMFDEEYYNAYEGMELTLKITLSGLECIYYPKAVAYHITGGSRNFLSYNDKIPGILFWTRWKKYIIPDITNYLETQITASILNEIFFLILCSDIPGWKKIISKLGINLSGEIVIHPYLSQKGINLYHELPYAALNYNGTYLFIVNHVSDLANNQNWVSVRRNTHDIVIDSHANVISFYELNKGQINE